MKKLKLKELKVQSFVTELNNGSALNGGIHTNGNINGRDRTVKGCANTNDDPDDSTHDGDIQSLNTLNPAGCFESIIIC